MKNFLKSKVPFLIICLLFVLFNLIFFVTVPFTCTLKGAQSSLWIGYGFTVLSFVLTACIAFFFRLRSKNSLTTVWPLLYAILGYFVLALIANIVFMSINKPIVVAPVVVNVVFLIIFAIVLLIVFKSISRVADNTARREERVFALRQISVKVNALTFLTEDQDVVKAIKKLKEDVDYSSSATTDAAKEYEDQFTDQIAALDSMIRQNADKEEILKGIRSAGNLLKLRNQLLMMK